MEACESASFGRYRVSVSLQSRVANLWSLKLLFAKLRKHVFMYTLGTANVGSYYQQLLPRSTPNNALQHTTGKIGGSPAENQERDPSIFYVLPSTFHLLSPAFYLLSSLFCLLSSKYLLSSIFYIRASISSLLCSLFYVNSSSRVEW